MDRAISIFAAMGFLGFCSIGLFAYLGDSIDENGILQEPFILLPIGHGMIWLSLAAIILLLFSRAIWRFIARRRQNNP